MNFDDNLQLCLSQKRIHNVLKRAGLDKPDCESIDAVSLSEVSCFARLPNPRRWIGIKEEQNTIFHSTIGQILNKFRKVETIVFSGTGDDAIIKGNIFKDFIQTKAKLGMLRVYANTIRDVDPYVFLAACKKFDAVHMASNGLPYDICTDEIFTELMPTTTFQVSNYCEDGTINEYALTDRTLEAFATHSTEGDVTVDYMLTSFTIGGIRKLFEVLSKKFSERGHYSLGVLKFEEEKNAIRWFNETQANPECSYTIERKEPTYPDQIITYAIGIKKCPRYCDSHNEPCLTFGIYEQHV